MTSPAQPLADRVAPVENRRRPQETVAPGVVRRAQIASLARFTPINSLATLCTSLLTTAILWPVAPRLGLIVWAAALAGPAT